MNLSTVFLVSWLALFQLCCQQVVALEVEVSVEAAWPTASLAAELLEGLAEVGRGPAYLQALGDLSASRPNISSWRRNVAVAAEARLCCGGSSLFARFLSVRVRHATASARVEAVRSLERMDHATFIAKGGDLDGLPWGGCSIGVPWVIIAAPASPVKTVCGAKALEDLDVEIRSGKFQFPPASSSAKKEALPNQVHHRHLDHALHSLEPSHPQALKAIGYADLGSPGAAAPLLRVLLGLTEAMKAKQHVGYVAFRHGAPAPEDLAPAILAGYGVALLAKGADEVTKSKDADGDAASPGQSAEMAEQIAEQTRQGSCSWESAEAGGAAQDPAEQFNGLNLDRIAARHPGAKPALCALRADLQASAGEPLPPWDLKYLGAYAAARATRAAQGLGGGLAGLRALEEAAQDFPSGWAHALAAENVGDEAHSRDLMRLVEHLPAVGQLEVNGWKVPATQRGVLQMLRAHSPLLYAVETLGQQGFDEAKVTEMLRESRPGPKQRDLYATGDPRLASKHDDSQAPIVIFDVRTDPDIEPLRVQNQNDNTRMGVQAQEGPLIRLAQNWGRHWDYPPPTPRALVGLGLTLDPCNKEHVRLAAAFLGSGAPSPIVVWLMFKSSAKDGASAKESEQTKRLIGLIRFALDALLKGPGAPAARAFLHHWYVSGQMKMSDICGGAAEDRLRAALLKSWPRQSAPPDLRPLDTAGDDSGQGLVEMPVPSATVNGRLLFGEEMTPSGVARLCKQEVDLVVRSLQGGGPHDLNMQSTDEDIAAWQYDVKSASALLNAYHPAIKPRPRRYIALAPEHLSALQGGDFHQSASTSSAELIVNVLLLADPVAISTEQETSTKEAGHLLEAYARRASASKNRRWWLGIAVAGKCQAPMGAPLGLAGAMRRCLSAATRVPGESNREATLLGVAKAWQEASPDIEKVTKDGSEDGEQKAAALMLEACSAVESLARRKDRLRLSQALVEEDDVTHCTSQREVELELGPTPIGSAMLLVNGRQYGPIFHKQEGVSFSAAHLALAEEIELVHGHRLRGGSGKELAKLKKLLQIGDGDNPLRLAYVLAVRARAVEQALALQAKGGGGDDEESLGQAAQEEEDDSDDQGVSRLAQAFHAAPDSLKITIPCRPGTACPFQMFAVLDPLGEDAQQLPAMLTSLHEELNAEINVILKPKALVSNPLHKYYRVARAKSAPLGGLASLGEWDGSGQGARFVLPRRRGLLLGTLLHTPDAWLCSPVDSGGADLDSLSADTDATVRARYAVEAMFVEGWASTVSGVNWQGPAAGKHLALVPLGGAATQEAMAGSGSVVVKSGYFQVRVPPGLYNLVLQGNESETVLVPKGPVELSDLVGRGSTLQVRVGAHPAGTAPAVVSTPLSAAATGSTSDGAGGDKNVCTETIHIFSVASGHRYERLLRIMMLSVREHTKCPLRLWLIDNFLSPQFRKLLPALGEKVGFAVSRVTYKWPEWLRQQTEKQRVIWAYKILFLDVLFPLQVKRVLFIDADQIVRADVKELWDINLQGNVYGFVPFCGSNRKDRSWVSRARDDPASYKNPDTLGHRFWEQGFWASHLGRDHHYHISALFVVDLERFRSVGAGDILRDSYQSLTNDPHSLSNLDQDLPNYVQMSGVLRIFSLPQEWLWCETWCGESTKAQAKTIDMCQNPVRKEGKLESARRIAPEWSDYDKRLTVMIQEASNESGI